MGLGYWLFMTENGNLLFYDIKIEIIWQSKTEGRGKYVKLDDDGNLVVYDSRGERIWSSKGTVFFSKSFYSRIIKQNFIIYLY